MAKKRKASRAAVAPAGPKDYDPKDARLGPVASFVDIADEQETYFLDRDKILFDDEPGTKRQRRQQDEDEFLELSDQEVLAGDNTDDSENEDTANARQAKNKARKAKKVKKARTAEKLASKTTANDDDEADEAEEDGDAEDDQGWWGSSKMEYYNGEVIETEDNAREEEDEARRLQQKQLSRMATSDFFDEGEWAAGTTSEVSGTGATATSTTNGNVTVVTMKTAEEIRTMTADEQYKLLQSLYPEIGHLCDAFSELEPQLPAYKKAAEGCPGTSLEAVRYRVLACYLSTLALYFSLLTAPARDQPGGARLLTDPDELHDHEVMEYLVECRQTWHWVQRVEARRKDIQKSRLAETATPPKPGTKDSLSLLATVSEGATAVEDKKARKKKHDTSALKTAQTTKKDKKDKKAKRSGEVSKEVEASLVDLSELLNKARLKKAKARAARPTTAASEDSSDNQSDFGEEETMDARTAAEKLKRKKSLGFYTSQIMQKASLRTGASGAGGVAATTGGDLDIPYRERLRDRQARLNAAAERRGQAADDGALGGSSSDEDAANANDDEDNDENLQYYNSIVRRHQAKQDLKTTRKAEEEALRLQRVEPGQAADADGRRQLSWQIAKNKGLNHKTLKEKKNNPRVKKRIKFEKKQRQLASMRPIYKPVDRNKYQGERTGIKTDIVRAIKL